MSSADERTPLTQPEMAGPSYITPRRNRETQIKTFQCCICSTFGAIMVVAIIVTISYAIKNTDEYPDIDNGTTTIAPGSTTEIDTANATNLDPFNLLLLRTWPIPDEATDKWNTTTPNATQIDEALSAGKEALGARDILEEDIATPMVNSPTFKHQKSISTTPEARIVSKRGFVEVAATLEIGKTIQKPNKAIRWSIGKGSKLDVGEHKKTSQCDFNSKYRRANGTCNNKANPDTFGVALRPFRRHLNPDYEDGINKPRCSLSGKDLPSARMISIGVHRPTYQSDPHFTVMLAVWGQFLDHDITATALVQGQNGQPIECCEKGEPKHPDCFPVSLAKGDPYFDNYNLTCMNFVRSAPAPTGHLGPRQQLNQASAFIDGSVVYGSTDSKIALLRTHENGELRMFNTPDNRTLLPVNTDPKDGCNEADENSKGKYCFESGDTRANENLHLTSMHLIWARQHNYLARGLKSVNPHWDDERIFQEGRKILGAQLQHIHYNEFLPVLLGVNYSETVGISPKSHSGDTYDENVDSSIANGFAAAAFRFAHTLLPGLLKATKNESNPDGIELHKMLFNPYSLWAPNGLDNAVYSAVNTQLARSDPFFTTELTEKLFASRKAGKPCGLDLVSLNIQRGRDHGLPGYPEWRKHCNLSVIQNWEDLKGVIDDGSLGRMRSIYSDPMDVDVYTGALSEPPMEGAIVGPLLACLITDQFMRIKVGDSFWYERENGPQKFTPEQLEQIYGTTLAGIICRNSDQVTESQKYVMRTVTPANPIVNCSELDTFSFEPWLEDTSNPTGNLHVIPMPSDQMSVISKKSKT